MVELGEQRPLMLLCPLALRDIDIDAHDPLRTAIAVVGNEDARIDPPNLATRANNTIIHAVLVRPLSENEPAKLFQPRHILMVHTGYPLLACDLGRAIGEAMDGRIARRYLHPLRIDVVGEAADQRGLLGKRELQGALGQRQLGCLALGDVSRQPFDPQQSACGVEFALCRLLQPNLPAVRSAKPEAQSIGCVVGAKLMNMGFEALAVVGVDPTEELIAVRTANRVSLVSENATRVVAAS